MRKGCIRFVVAVILAIPKINSWAQLPELAPADLSQLKPADFADDELDMPYFIAHLSKVAIQLAGEFTENIPLLVGQKDAVLLKPGRAELGRLVVTFDATSKPRLQDVEERRPFRQSPFGSKSVRVLHLDSRDALAYVLKFQD